MKKLLITLFCLSSLNFAQAATTKREDIKFLKCVRRVLTPKRIDFAALNKLFYTIKDYKANGPEVSLKTCHEILAEVKDLPRLNQDEMETILYKVNNAHDYSVGWNAMRILDNMIDNYSECILNSAGVDAAFGIGGGVGLGVGTCHRGDGRVFAIVAPRISYGIGGGIVVTLGRQHFTLINNKVVEDGGFTYGAILAEREMDGNENAYGVGLGLMLEDGVIIPLKVLPVGNDFRESRKYLIKD